MTANAGHGPGGASGDAVHEPAQIGNGSGGATGHAQHEVELHGGSGNFTLAGHVQDGVEVTHLEALVFGLDATLNHALAEGTHGGHRVVKDFVAEVAGTAVERCHLGQRGRVGGL